MFILSKKCDVWPIGPEYEPMRIVVKFFDKSFKINEVSFTFTKCSLITHVKEEISQILLCDLNEGSEKKFELSNLIFTLVQANKNEKTVLEASQYDHKSLSDALIKNGDCITIELKDFDKILDKNQSDQAILTTITQINAKDLVKINVINLIIKPSELGAANFSANELNVECGEKISNLLFIAMSSFDVDLKHMENCHLRYINDENLNENELMMQFANSLSTNFNSIGSCLSDDQNFISTTFFSVPGVCLHGDDSLNEVLSSNKKSDSDEKPIFLLCPNRAPLLSNNEISIKCHLDQKLSSQLIDTPLNEKIVEVMINSNDCKVQELTNKLAEKMKLKPIEAGDDEKYFLKTLNWLGDPEIVLNDSSIPCKDVPLKHNQQLFLTKGKLIPPNHFKIKVWLSTLYPSSIESLTKKMSEQTLEAQDEVILNGLIEDKSKEFKLLDELIIANDTKLEELKSLIESLLIGRNDVPKCEHIRLRVMKRQKNEHCLNQESVNFQMKKALFDWNKPLKQLHLLQESDIGVEIIDEEDNLNQGLVILDCVRVNLKTKLCQKSTFKQIFWNINNGATLNSLKESILKAYSDQLEPSDVFKMFIAKRIVGKCQWILLKEIEVKGTSAEGGQGKKKKKGGSANASNAQQKSNLKQAPFNMDDGDLIAFTIADSISGESGQAISANDFMSSEDTEFNKKANITAAELSRLRKEKKEAEKNDKKLKPVRPERGIHIKIDDFN